VGQPSSRIRAFQPSRSPHSKSSSGSGARSTPMSAETGIPWVVGDEVRRLIEAEFVAARVIAHRSSWASRAAVFARAMYSSARSASCWR
jgi:hypothetical protein